MVALQGALAVRVISTKFGWFLQCALRARSHASSEYHTKACLWCLRVQFYIVEYSFLAFIGYQEVIKSTFVFSHFDFFEKVNGSNAS